MYFFGFTFKVVFLLLRFSKKKKKKKKKPVKFRQSEYKQPHRFETLSDQQALQHVLPYRLLL
jgi:hypothetical protein